MKASCILFEDIWIGTFIVLTRYDKLKIERKTIIGIPPWNVELAHLQIKKKTFSSSLSHLFNLTKPYEKGDIKISVTLSIIVVLVHVNKCDY